MSIYLSTVVRLVPSDYEQDDLDARRDHERVIRGKWREVGYMPPGGMDQRLEYRIASYRSERAFAIYRGVCFRRDPDGFHKPDVDGYSVRYGARESYGLVVHDRDAVAPYVLVVRHHTPVMFRVAGYCPHANALELRAARIGLALPGSTAPWCIPQTHLRAEPPH